MNKLVLIVPYFGKFPNYFQLFLNSCAINDDMCDWLIYTDDRTYFVYPNNVLVKYCTFSEIQERIKKAISCTSCIERPYKLCDYRPAYGLIFEDDIVNYSYWGHCDIDVIFGKMSHFLNDQILKYDKLFRLGHLCFYKNTKCNNKRFMLSINDSFRYKEVFSDPNNCIFDEVNESGSISIEDVWNFYGFSTYKNDNIIANVYYKSNFLQLTYQSDGFQFNIEKIFRNYFIWDKNGLVRYYVCDGELHKKEFLYLHMMKRKMNINCAMDSNIMKIISNSFEPVENHPSDLQQFYKEKWHRMNFQYFKVRYNNLKIKIKKRLYFNV